MRIKITIEVDVEAAPDRAMFEELSETLESATAECLEEILEYDVPAGTDEEDIEDSDAVSVVIEVIEDQAFQAMAKQCRPLEAAGELDE